MSVLLAGTLSLHIAVASAVTILNKATLNIYPASVTLLALNVAQTLVAFHLASLVGKAALPHTITLPKVREHAFLALLNVVALTMKTVCLGLVDASFYQVARGLLLPLSVGLSRVILGQRTSQLSNLGIVIICLGFLMGVSLDSVASTSPVGVFMGVFSSLTTALYVVMMKRATNKSNKLKQQQTAAAVGGPGSAAAAFAGVPTPEEEFWEVAYYNSLLTLAGLVVLVPIVHETGFFSTILLGWLGSANATGQSDVAQASPAVVRAFLGMSFWSGLSFAALTAVTLLQVKLTSPIAHMVSAALRGIVQSGIALLFFPSEKAAFGLSRVLSTALIIVGSSVYALGEASEKRKKEHSLGGAGGATGRSAVTGGFK